MDYLKLFNTVNDAVSYELSSSYVEPYCSYSIDESSVRYNSKFPYILCKYNVTDASSETLLINLSKYDYGTNGNINLAEELAKIEVDGEVIIPEVGDTYLSRQLSVGEHTAKFTFADDTLNVSPFMNCITLTQVEFHGFKTIESKANGSSAYGSYGFFMNCSNIEAVYFDETLESFSIWVVYNLRCNMAFLNENVALDIYNALVYNYIRNSTIYLMPNAYNNLVNLIENDSSFTLEERNVTLHEITEQPDNLNDR